MLYKTQVEKVYKDKKTGALINANVSEKKRYNDKKQFYRDFENMKSMVFALQKKVDELQQEIRDNKWQ